MKRDRMGQVLDLLYQDETLRDLPCQTIQADEIWSYCYAKQKNIPEQHKGTFGYGDVWTWTAICDYSRSPAASRASSRFKTWTCPSVYRHLFWFTRSGQAAALLLASPACRRGH